MSVKLKPYSEYKDSGAPWPRQVPEHWKMRRAKWVFRCIDVRSDAGKEELLTVSAKDGVVPRSQKKVTMFMAESYEGYKLCWPGDLVINSLWAWANGLGFSRHHGIVSSAYGVYRPRIAFVDHWPYFDNLLRSEAYDWEFHVRSKGIWVSRLQLTDESFLDMPIVLPPAEEAKQISIFLTSVCSRINRYIRTKQKLIKLLEEQKKAIIHCAVTRGTDFNVQLKSADIPWVSEYPAHWDCVPIKRLLCRMDYGTSEVSTENGTIRVLTMGNIQKGEVIVPLSGGLDEVPDSLLLEHHDLLFTRTNGNPDLVGKVGIFRGHIADKVSFASYLVRLRVKRPHEPRWLHMLLNSTAFWPFARSHALVNLQTNLNSTRYGQFLVPVPPPVEQRRIIEWVAEKSMPMNTAVTRIEKEIELLREYRARLIADVVTGKLDVRGIELPALVEEDVVEDLVEVEEVETETDEEVELVAETTNADN